MGTNAFSPPASTWICARCAHEQNTPDPQIMPKDWQLHVDEGTSGKSVICADCMPLVTASISIVGQECFVIQEPVDPCFSVHLRRQPRNEYCVALLPVRVMTLHGPTAFLLAPGEAEALAADLARYADLARNPGTLGASA